MRYFAVWFLAFVSGISGAWAESYPSRTVRIIVPAAPAGITDLAARVVAERLQALWGVSVVIENKPGGGGSIGVTSFKHATPDGYTLLMTTNGELALRPVIHKDTQYDTAKDFVPLAMLTNNPIMLIANTNSPYKTLADVIAAAKKEPSKLPWASPGVGTWNHLTGEWLWSATGVKLVHIPYRGGGPSAAAVSAGDVPLGVVAISSALPHIQAGRVRALALTTDTRSKIDPSWPTVAETAVPGFNSLQWVGLYARAGTDPKVSEKVATDTLAIMADPKVRQRFEAMGIDPIGLNGAEAAKQLERDVAISKKISAEAHINAD